MPTSWTELSLWEIHPLKSFLFKSHFLHRVCFNLIFFPFSFFFLSLYFIYFSLIYFSFFFQHSFRPYIDQLRNMRINNTKATACRPQLLPQDGHLQAAAAQFFRLELQTLRGLFQRLRRQQLLSLSHATALLPLRLQPHGLPGLHRWRAGARQQAHLRLRMPLHLRDVPLFSPTHSGPPPRAPFSPHPRPHRLCSRRCHAVERDAGRRRALRTHLPHLLATRLRSPSASFHPFQPMGVSLH